MIVNANALHIPLADGCVQTVVTSPPYYGLRSYGIGTENGEIGLEQTPELYVANLVAVFREVKRVLRDDGVLWLNLGDSYATHGGSKGSKHPHNFRSPEVAEREGIYRPKPFGAQIGLKEKDLIGIPWRVAFALQADGWYLRSDIIWHKPNSMPESVTDRPTKSHEYLFLLTKSPRYYYDAQAILEPAAYDGRKDTRFKGSTKYKDSGQTFAERGHERWPNSIDTKYTEDDAANMGGAGTNWVGHSAYHGADGRELFHRNAEGIPARNKRSVWTINTQPVHLAHFSTFPEKLVEPCILAGTSERGCCPKCGAPYVREVERTSMVIDRSERTHELGRTRSSGTMLEPPTSKTLGWQPSCECDAGDPVPCVVFDPFAGSGTVERVAIRLGRRSAGCELNYRYIADIASRRTTEIQVRMI